MLEVDAASSLSAATCELAAIAVEISMVAAGVARVCEAVVVAGSLLMSGGKTGSWAVTGTGVEITAAGGGGGGGVVIAVEGIGDSSFPGMPQRLGFGLAMLVVRGGGRRRRLRKNKF